MPTSPSATSSSILSSSTAWRYDKYTLGDGMHPNAEGVARIVDGILPKVEELLAKEKPRP